MAPVTKIRLLKCAVLSVPCSDRGEKGIDGRQAGIRLHQTHLCLVGRRQRGGVARHEQRKAGARRPGEHRSPAPAGGPTLKSALARTWPEASDACRWCAPPSMAIAAECPDCGRGYALPSRVRLTGLLPAVAFRTASCASPVLAMGAPVVGEPLHAQTSTMEPTSHERMSILMSVLGCGTVDGA